MSKKRRVIFSDECVVYRSSRSRNIVFWFKQNPYYCKEVFSTDIIFSTDGKISFCVGSPLAEKIIFQYWCFLSLIGFTWLLYNFCPFISNNRKKYCFPAYFWAHFVVFLQKYLRNLKGETTCCIFANKYIYFPLVFPFELLTF